MPHASDDPSDRDAAPDQHETPPSGEPGPAPGAADADDLTKNQGVPNDGRVDDEETLRGND